MPFIPVCQRTEIPEGGTKRVVVNGRELCLYNLSDGVFATDNICTHARASLAQGRVVDDHVIECPRHGSQFAIRTGTVMGLPAYVPLRTFPVKIENDMVHVEVDASPIPKPHEDH